MVSDDKMLNFKEAWAEKEAEGYQYGHDALEQVRFGWDMRAAVEKRLKIDKLLRTAEKLIAARTENKQLREALEEVLFWDPPDGQEAVWERARMVLNNDITPIVQHE